MQGKHIIENLFLSFVVIARDQVGRWAPKHARHVAMWARNHARHGGTWSRRARSLADSYKGVNSSKITLVEKKRNCNRWRENC